MSQDRLESPINLLVNCRPELSGIFISILFRATNSNLIYSQLSHNPMCMIRSHDSLFSTLFATTFEPDLSTLSNIFSIVTSAISALLIGLKSLHGSVISKFDSILSRISCETFVVFSPNGSNPVSKILGMNILRSTNF